MSKQIDAPKLALEALKSSNKLINGTGTKFGLAGAMDGYYSGCFDVEGNNKLIKEAITAIETKLAKQCQIEKQVGEIIKSLRCPNCESLERQNAELDLRLAEQDQEPFGFLTNKRQRFNFEPNATGLSNMPMTIDWKIPLYGAPQPQPKEPEQEPVAIYQYQMGNGSWIDQDKGSYRYNKQHGHTVRIVYTTPPQRKPLTDEQVNECGMCGYVGKNKGNTGQCPKCRWDELRPLIGKLPQKPLTDEQIYEMYNEPRSDSEMLEFARAIEAAHGIKGD